MTTTTFVIVVCLCAVVWSFWRLASRRSSLPCPVWLSWMVELDNPFAKTNRAATIIENLDIQKGMAVLDIGCGPGRVCIPLARQIGPTGKVVAMDIQAGMLEKTRKKAREASLGNLEFLQAGAGEGKMGSNLFDRVLLVTVLGEIPDREKAMQEIHAALKPGGILSVTEIIFDPHFQKRETVAGLAGRVGFQESGFFGNRLAYTLNLKKAKAETEPTQDQEEPCRI